jgi:phosphoribosylformylglycinamidine cyclo-ligase
MCVNDILTCGAEPLFFLDYYASGRLDPETGAAVIAGIGEGCRQAGAALVGGETAEMPGIYQPGDYDLAGFCVGVVDKGRIVDGRDVAAGDRLLGLASSGPHSNGYSLIRRVLERSGAELSSPCGEATLADALMAPTRIYVRPVLDLLASVAVRGMAHITGGGIPGNLVRILPPGRRARIARSSWPVPPVFEWLAGTGPVRHDEMFRTFNCGIGMILAVAPADVDAAASRLRAAGEQVYEIGVIESGQREVIIE